MLGCDQSAQILDSLTEGTAMEAENVALKPNSDLLDPNFEGYKLNLDKIPIHCKEIKQGVLQAPESASNYSYQQVRLHALHNHLWADPWHAGLSYYFSSPGTLHSVLLDESPGLASPLRGGAVLILPAGDTADSQPTLAAHPSVSLAADQLAVLSDGRGKLHVANTGDRRQLPEWQIQFSGSPLDDCSFVLVHSVVDPDGQLHVLAEHVALVEDLPEWKSDTKDATFVNVLSWLTLAKAGDGWRLARLRQAATAGTVHYACLESTGAALCVAAERPVTVIRDTERPVAPPTAAVPPATDAAPPAAPLYQWSQTAEDVTVQLTSSVASGEAVRVLLKPRELTVTAGCGTELLQGQLAAAIKRDESTWTVDDGRVELVLAKVEQGQIWQELLTGDQRGEQIVDPELQSESETVAAAIAQSGDTADKKEPDHEKAGMVGAEIEDCDDFPEHSSSMLRIDGDTHAATHMASLSSHQYLMTARLAAAEQPAFCIRHDVDALVWQPRTLDGRYQCEHVGTLQAFGFVQASKQQRKFLACAPDMSYAVICETSRHVYIYHQPSPVAGDLRNRKTGRRVTQVSRQQVVSLDDQEPILGVTAAAGAIYVLTAGRLHVLVLRRD